MKVSEITVKNLADYLKLDYSSLAEEEIIELATFLQVAQRFVADYTGLSNDEIDEHETFVIAVYVLVQDMYDNRSYYVDKSNLNRVVEMILGMHSVNLL
ncbi:MAG: head-tail connector protein [Bacilli bacterium]